MTAVGRLQARIDSRTLWDVEADIREVLAENARLTVEVVRRTLQRDNAHKARITTEEERDRIATENRELREAFDIATALLAQEGPL